MKYELPKKILEKKIISAKESADFYEVDATAHPSTSLPIPTTRFQTEFLQLAEELKEKVGLASPRKRVERPKNNTKLDSKGNLIGDVDTEEDGDGEINRIDLKDKAKTVYEGSQKAKRGIINPELPEKVVNESVKRPNFKKKSKKGEPSKEELKDERDSRDKQPKEAVACENSDWTKLTVIEDRLISSRDERGIRNNIPSKIRQRYLLDRMATESAAHESTAMEGDEEEDVKYYVYEFYEDGSLGNTAYSDLFQASGAYQKSELPRSFIARDDITKKFVILEGEGISEEQEVNLTEALNVLNEDGKPMIADEGVEKENKNLFTNKNSGGGSKLVIRNEQKPRNESIKVSKEELGIVEDKKKEEQGKEENYVIKNLQEDSLLRKLDGSPETFDTIDRAQKFATEELGLLDEDFEVLTKETVPAKEFISSTWYALVATESNQQIDSVVINSDRPSSREEAKKHLEKTYGKKAVYSVDSKPIKL